MALLYADLEMWQPIVGLPKLEKQKTIPGLEPVHFIFIFIVALLFITVKN